MKKTTHFTLLFFLFLFFFNSISAQILRGSLLSSRDSVTLAGLNLYIESVYQKRLTFLNQHVATFQNTLSDTDGRLRTLTDRKEELAKRKVFLMARANELTQTLSVDGQWITDTTLRRMVAYLKVCKVEEASNLVNAAQYKTMKQRHIESARDTHRLAELCLLAHLKAHCAMMQFNALQADFYFSESRFVRPAGVFECAFL